MNKLAKRTNNLAKRTNNKGFSLIELVIVVAIMAALIAILAPQYLKYVEKSRVTADKAVLNEIATAIKATASDPDSSYAWHATNDTAVVFSGTAGSTLTLQATDPTGFGTDLANILSDTTITLKSAQGKLMNTITFTVDTAPTASASYAVTCTGTGGTIGSIWDGAVAVAVPTT